MQKKILAFIFSGVILTLISILAVSQLTAQRQQLRITDSNPTITALPQLRNALEFQNVLRSIASNITPGVVSIDVEGYQNRNAPNDPFFQFFFGEQENLQRQYNSVGSGFIITPDGYFFSNWHVVEEAENIRVTLSDGRTFAAKLIGADTELDIALLKIDANNLPVVPIGNSDEVQVGDLVVAIGNPFGLSSTFTFGTVSGLGREGIIPGLQRFIQSDVAVNPGNSGGPLLNIQGQAIGINTAIRSRSGGYEGISFAVPINIARQIAEQLLNKGTIERGFLGVVPQELDNITRESLGISPNVGILISSLDSRGPASTAGIEQGDIILAVDGETISSPSQLTEIIAGKNPHTGVELTVLRNGSEKQIVVKLGIRPSALVRAEAPNPESEENPKNSLSFHGVVFSEASANELEQNGAKSGVVVQRINQNSPLSFILSQGDIIASINNVQTPNIKALQDWVTQNQQRRRLSFAIYQNGFLVYRSLEF